MELYNVFVNKPEINADVKDYGIKAYTLTMNYDTGYSVEVKYNDPGFEDFSFIDISWTSYITVTKEDVTSRVQAFVPSIVLHSLTWIFKNSGRRTYDRFQYVDSTGLCVTYAYNGGNLRLLSKRKISV